ncbi:hypothetical protein GCM10018784_69300 [Streptomyces hydrogenans]|nr:hypothetical protein GCM10018784_69300 [Streptomyces hydrogenans]
MVRTMLPPVPVKVSFWVKRAVPAFCVSRTARKTCRSVFCPKTGWVAVADGGGGAASCPPAEQAVSGKEMAARAAAERTLLEGMFR